MGIHAFKCTLFWITDQFLHQQHAVGENKCFNKTLFQFICALTFCLANKNIKVIISSDNVKVKDRVLSEELRERLGIDYIILILRQNRLRWHGHVLRKEDTDWVKKWLQAKR